MTRIKDEMRERIIEAARNTFSRFGYKKATLEDIARLTFKGKSSIYYYFSDKEEIFMAVVQKEAGLLRQELLLAMEKENNPLDKLKAYCITRIKTFSKMVNYYTAVKDDLLQRMPFIDTLRVQYDHDEMNIVKSIIEQGIKDGVFKKVEVESCARAIVIAMKGFEYPLMVQAEKSYESDIEYFINLLFHGICR